MTGVQTCALPIYWDIGQILGIAQSTVHAHVENAKRKLGVKSRIQAVAKLARAGEL